MTLVEAEPPTTATGAPITTGAAGSVTSANATSPAAADGDTVAVNTSVVPDPTGDGGNTDNTVEVTTGLNAT